MLKESNDLCGVKRKEGVNMEINSLACEYFRGLFTDLKSSHEGYLLSKLESLLFCLFLRRRVSK